MAMLWITCCLLLFVTMPLCFCANKSQPSQAKFQLSWHIYVKSPEKPKPNFSPHLLTRSQPVGFKFLPFSLSPGYPLGEVFQRAGTTAVQRDEDSKKSPESTNWITASIWWALGISSSNPISTWASPLIPQGLTIELSKSLGWIQDLILDPKQSRYSK